MRDNRGITLVELVVAVAITAVVGSAILGFLAFGLNQYKNNMEEIDLQSQAQVVENQMENLILNTTGAIGYETTGTEQKMWLIGSNNTKDQAVCITYDTQDRKINYQDYKYSESASVYRLESTGDVQPMADAVDDFALDLTELENGSVTISISYSLEKKQYQAEFQVTLRNSLQKAEYIEIP